MTSANAFSPADLSASVDNFNAELLLLTLHANTLSQQPDIVVPEVPGLPPHQQAARQTAQYLFTDVSPDFATVNSDVVAFANQFQAASQRLGDDAEVIDDATASADRRRASADDFAEGLTILLRLIDHAQSHGNDAADALASLGLRLEQNTAALGGDLTLAKKNLAEGTLAQLEAQLDAVQGALTRDNATIARGAVKGLVSALQIAVGIATAYKSPGEGIKLAVGGLEGAVAVGEEQQAALDDIQQQFAAYKSLMAQVASAQVAWAGVQNVNYAAVAMATHQSTANTALVKGITQSWSDMSKRLKELVDTLRGPNIPTNLGLGGQIADAATAWGDLKKAIVGWQSDGGIVTPVRSVRLV